MHVGEGVYAHSGHQAICFTTHCQSFKLFKFSFQPWIEFLKWREQLLQLCWRQLVICLPSRFDVAS